MTIGDSTQIINGTSCPVPTGSTGDVLGVWTLDVTAVAGFSQRGTPVTFDGLSVAYWTRTRDGSEGANISMTGGGSFPCGQMVNMSGVVEAPTIPTIATGTGTTATTNTVAAAGDLVCWFAVASGEEL